jgi:USP6 N-terminal-like protein
MDLTPLHISEAAGHDDVSYILVSNGADVSIRYEAARKLRESDHDPVFARITDDDAELDLISKADRFGYLEGAEGTTLDISREVAEKNRTKELHHAQKWAKMIRNIDDYRTGRRRAKLRKRVYKGIPDALRGMYWVGILEADKLIAEKAKTKHTYEYYKKKTATIVGASTANQIDLDIKRTHQDHLQFRERYGQGQTTLFSILTAYSALDRKVDYCQGMNDVAGVLLMYMVEEQVFWCMSMLLRAEKFGLGGRMEDGFPELHKSFWVHDKLLARHLPKLSKFFAGPPEDEDGSGMPPATPHKGLEMKMSAPIYAHRWFMMVFLGELPVETVNHVWDVFFLEGYWIVHVVAIHLLELCEKELLRSSFEEVMDFMKNSDNPLKLRATSDAREFIAGVKRTAKKVKRSEITGLEKRYDKDGHRNVQEERHSETVKRRQQFKDSQS